METMQTAYEKPDLTKEARRSYSRAELNLAIYGIVGELLVVAIAMIAKSLFQNIPLTVGYMLNFLPMYFIMFPVYLALSRKVPAAPPAPHKMSFGQMILALFMCEGLAIVGSTIGVIINILLSVAFGKNVTDTTLSDAVMGDGFVAISVFAVLFAPIVEEMLFRKVFIDHVRKYGEGTAILFSGLLFGAFHGNFTQFFYAAALGMFFAFIYVRTGKVRYTIVLHMIVNFMGSVVARLVLKGVNYEELLGKLPTLSDIDFSSDMNELLTISAEMTATLIELLPLLIYEGVIMCMAITGIVMFFIKRKQLKVSPTVVPARQLRRAACMNAGFCFLILYCAALFVYSILSGVFT